MRNASFMLTEQQVVDETKTVTRRLNWHWAKPGMLLQAVRKSMGRKKGEPLLKLKVIEIVSVRREPLQLLLDDRYYGVYECILEGFPKLMPEEFVKMFCQHMKCKPDREVARVRFKYVKETA